MKELNNITSARYLQNLAGENFAVLVVDNGKEYNVPMNTANRHYAAILEWAEEDGNEIQAAE